MARRTSAFSVASALEGGATREQLRSLPLDQPFHGMRAPIGAIHDHLDLCMAYAVKMRTHWAFCGVSAAIIWGLPLPAYLAGTDSVSVSAALPGRAPRGRAVIGRTHDPDRVEVARYSNLPVMSPEDTWCSLGRLLEVHDLVAVGDMLVTPAFGTARALSTLDRLRAASERHARTPGAERIRTALGLIRVGPLSRPESLYRFACVAVGIPEPLPNFTTRVRDTNVMLDGAWPLYRSAFEYDGDHHRDRAAFQKGLHRATLIRDEWALLQIGASALFGDTVGTMDRTALMLRAGGWRPDRRVDTTRTPRFRP